MSYRWIGRCFIILNGYMDRIAEQTAVRAYERMSPVAACTHPHVNSDQVVAGEDKE